MLMNHSQHISLNSFFIKFLISNMQVIFEISNLFFFIENSCYIAEEDDDNPLLIGFGPLGTSCAVAWNSRFVLLVVVVPPPPLAPGGGWVVLLGGEIVAPLWNLVVDWFLVWESRTTLPYDAKETFNIAWELMRRAERGTIKRRKRKSDIAWDFVKIL